MKNSTLINKILDRFNKVYDYTDLAGGDDPLNVLDDALDRINLYDEYSAIMESFVEDLPAPELANNDLVAILACVNDVIIELRSEYGRLRSF